MRQELRAKKNVSNCYDRGQIVWGQNVRARPVFKRHTAKTVRRHGRLVCSVHLRGLWS